MDHPTYAKMVLEALEGQGRTGLTKTGVCGAIIKKYVGIWRVRNYNKSHVKACVAQRVDSRAWRAARGAQGMTPGPSVFFNFPDSRGDAQ